MEPAHLDADGQQHAALGLLIERHPALVDLDELELAGVDVDQAVALLVGDGLATRLGDPLGCTRAAVRADQLAL